VKTTFNLDDDLMRAAKERARQRGVTLTALIAEALRRELAETGEPTEFRIDLPVTRGRRAPTINIDSNAAVEEYLDQISYGDGRNDRS
jgi:hypothetical protein